MLKKLFTFIFILLLPSFSLAETPEEKGKNIAKKSYENTRGVIDSESD